MQDSSRFGTPAASPSSAEEAQRLLEAAMQASQAGDDDRSFALLRDSVAASHANPVAHYLLGAEHAQRQQYGDAVLHMTTAVEQAPGLSAARLQLGLLWLSLGNPMAALPALQPLADLPQADPLRHFGRGLIALCRDALPEAAAHLADGLQRRPDNPPLVSDMQRLLQSVEAALANATDPSPSLSMAISAYTARGTEH